MWAVAKTANRMPVRKATVQGRNTLADLSNYINTHTPKMARWLYDSWNAERDAIKYHELASALLFGLDLTPWLDQWQQDYASLVLTNFVPAWVAAMQAANHHLQTAYPGWVFDPTMPAVQQWTLNRADRLPVNLAQSQLDALRGVVQQATLLQGLGPDELSRMIRPLVGMVPREAAAVANFYNTLKKEGMGPKKAQAQATNYAMRVHRHRAMRIARTEIAFAFNTGADEGVKQAQKAGYLGIVQKRWLTADDERVCLICGGLENTVVSQHSTFPGGYDYPPAHPHCRCAVAYEEI